MSDEKNGADPKPAPKSKRERSPSFPFIPLAGAIKRLIEFENYFKRHPAPAKHSGKAWGMKGWTSQAQQTLAALKSFGLVDYQGSGDTLEAVISDDGRTYLRAQQDTIKREVLKRAALKPKTLAKYFSVWGTDRPPEDMCLDQLVLKGGFTDAAAKLFLSVYDATIDYAGLTDSDKSSADDGAADEEADASSLPPPLREGSPVKVGDYVQWTSNGVDQFKPARRVTWVSEDGTHLRVHGSMTGIPMNEVALADAPIVPPISGSAQHDAMKFAGAAGDLNVLLTGDRLQITADVDLAGLERLREVLGYYENILKLVTAPKQQN
jgi:hypothetical protein